MKCELCHQQDAETVFFRQAEDGTEEELYVCHACATRERAFTQSHKIQVAAMDAPPPQGMPQPPPPMDLPEGIGPIPLPAEILQQLKRIVGKDIALPTAPFENFELPFDEKDATKCPDCGKTIAKIEAEGAIGCTTCYRVFEKEITELLDELQNCTHYPAPPPQWLADEVKLKQLQERYRDALIREDFDAAQALSADIDALKKKLETPPSDEEDSHES